MHLLLGCYCVTYTHTHTSAADPQEAFLLRLQKSGTLLSEALSHAGVCCGWSWKPDPFLVHTNMERATPSFPRPPRQWDPLVFRSGKWGGCKSMFPGCTSLSDLHCNCRDRKPGSVVFASGACREEAVTCAGSQNTAVTHVPLRVKCREHRRKTVTFDPCDDH